jgi:hypothetical protein
VLSARRIVENLTFHFISTLQFKPKFRLWHHIVYIAVELILIVQILSLMFDSRYHWSKLSVGYNHIDNIRYIGLQYASYNFFQYLTGVVGSLQLILLLSIAIEYRSHSKGVTTWIIGDRLKVFIKLLLFVSILLSFPIVYGLTAYTDCIYSEPKSSSTTTAAHYLRRFSGNIQCWSVEVTIWGVIALVLCFVQIVTSTLGVFVYVLIHSYWRLTIV